MSAPAGRKKQPPNGSKDGVEWVTRQGGKKYRYVINSKTGKRRGPWTTHAQAKAGRVKALGELQAGTLALASAETIREAWAEFIAAAKKGTATARGGQKFKGSSLRFLENGFEKIDSHLGAQKLSDVRRADVQDLVDRLAAEGMSPYQLRNAMSPLRILYRRALVRDKVAVNPTVGIELPSVSRQSKVTVLSPEQASALVVAIRDKDRATWATALYAGLRRGELQALRWKHVDFKANVITVRRSYDTGGKIEQEPKSKNAIRDVPIVSPLRLLLEEHRERVADGAEDLVFGDQSQVYFSPPPLRNRALTDWKAAGLDPVTLHTCRHTFASFLIAAGVNAKALSLLVGHANIQTTFDVYGHLMPGGAEEAGRRLEEFLTPPVADDSEEADE